MNHYKKESHQEVSDAIKNIRNIKWIVSYDNAPEIKKLYSDCPTKEYSFKHTAYRIRMGNEILIFSTKLKQPDIKDWNPLQFKIKRFLDKKIITYELKLRSRKIQIY